MNRKVGIVLNALITVLALVSATLRFPDGELLFFAILLLLTVLNAVALILNLKQKGNQEK